MPRGSNTEAEKSRVMSREDAPERSIKSGTGVHPHEKIGFGRTSMQKNKDSNRKTPMG
jgi:hypothetical protein